MKEDLWLFSDGQMLTEVDLKLFLLNAPFKELQHVLPEPSFSLQCEDPVRLYLFGKLGQFAQTCLLSFPVLADIERELPNQG